MKKSLYITSAVIYILFLSIFTNAQERRGIPEKGFWVVVSNIHIKRNATVQFYDDHSNLIYEERIADTRIDIKKKRIRLLLKAGLEKSLMAWKKNNEVIRNGYIVASMMHKMK